MGFSSQTDRNIRNFIELIETLRGKNGCPWDKKQTPQSMTIYLLEELYELIEAIESGTPEDVCEELGDVWFHILFIARLYEEMGHFGIGEVARVNTEKMIRRHPHVFGEDKIDNAEEVKKRWHTIKMNETNHMTQDSVLDSVPVKLPALMRAYRISERAAKTGFDWNHLSEVLQKAEEEWSEFKSASTQPLRNENDRNQISIELGDVLFTLVNVARFARIHPETALSEAIKKFEKRFRYMERTLSESGRKLDSLSQKEMDTAWEEAKKKVDPYP